MKKFTILFSFLLVFFITQSAYSLPEFMYKDIALDPDGEIIASVDWNNRVYVDMRLSLYEDDDMVFQQNFEDEWVDQFGYFNVWFGYYYDEEESTWVDISDIRATADLRIKIEIYDRSEGWYTVAFKQLTEAMRNQGGFQGTIVKNTDDANGDTPNNIERAKRLNKDGGSLNTNNSGNLRDMSKIALVESNQANFDASKGNVFVYTGSEAALNVINPTAGQTIFVSKSEGEGMLNFGGVAIATGETYQFLYNGRNWSRVK